jgi:hypothetical protein
MSVYIYHSYNNDKNVIVFEVVVSARLLFWTFWPYSNNCHPSFCLLFYSPLAPQACVNQPDMQFLTVIFEITHLDF